MSDLIERSEVLKQLRLNHKDVVYIDKNECARRIEAIPSAESTWADTLAELHERFDALEKEIRKTSAEMSAIIREYADRPKGEWMPIGAVCEVICKHCIKANGHCQHHWRCPLLTEIAKLMEPKDEPQTDIHGLTDCDFCKEKNCEDCEGGKDEPQTCSVSGRPYSECADCEYFRCTADEPRADCSKCETYWNCQGQCDETPQIEENPPTKCDLCKREGDDICLDCERKKQSGKE